MALNEEFYSEIYNKEKEWISQINDNLLNAIYCDYAIKVFYLLKRKKLKEEYSLNKNDSILKIINSINIILKKVDEIGNQYRSGVNVDMSTLIPLFLINQIDNQNNFSKIDKLNIQSQVLKSISRKISSTKSLDYTYDDFPHDYKIK